MPFSLLTHNEFTNPVIVCAVQVETYLSGVTHTCCTVSKMNNLQQSCQATTLLFILSSNMIKIINQIAAKNISNSPTMARQITYNKGTFCLMEFSSSEMSEIYLLLLNGRTIMNDRPPWLKLSCSTQADRHSLQGWLQSWVTDERDPDGALTRTAENFVPCPL